MISKIKFNHILVATFAAMGIMAFGLYGNVSAVSINDIALSNIEALTIEESGAKCPNGCASIGWGTDKILECDCNYDHFSSCDRWGC